MVMVINCLLLFSWHFGFGLVLLLLFCLLVFCFDKGSLHMLSGNSAVSFFSKKNLWEMLVLCHATDITEEQYKKRTKLLTDHYFQLLLKLFDIEM